MQTSEPILRRHIKSVTFFLKKEEKMSRKLTRQERETQLAKLDWDELQEELTRLRKAAGQIGFRFDPSAVRSRIRSEILEAEEQLNDRSKPSGREQCS